MSVSCRSRAVISSARARRAFLASVSVMAGRSAFSFAATCSSMVSRALLKLALRLAQLSLTAAEIRFLGQLLLKTAAGVGVEGSASASVTGICVRLQIYLQRLEIGIRCEDAIAGSGAMN
jgi:hypothetical protein